MEETNNEQSNSISLLDILFILKKHLAAICIFIVAGIAAGVGFNYIQAPVYSSSATMLAMPEYTKTSAYSTSDYNFLSYVSDTIVALIKEDVVLKETVNYLKDEKNIELSKTELKKGITVTADSLIIKVTYKNEIKEDTPIVVNALTHCVQEIANQKDGSGVYKYKLLGGNLVVLSDANEEAGGLRISKTVKNLAIFTAIGVVIAAAYTFVYELLDTRFKSSEELERIIGIPVISAIPEYNLESKESK